MAYVHLQDHIKEISAMQTSTSTSYSLPTHFIELQNWLKVNLPSSLFSHPTKPSTFSFCYFMYYIFWVAVRRQATAKDLERWKQCSRDA
jgi:hypothetical protein